MTATGPQADVPLLLNHLVSAAEQGDPALQNLADKVGAAPPEVQEAWSIAYQAASTHMPTVTENSWQSYVVGQSDDMCTVGVYEWIVGDVKRFRAQVGPIEWHVRSESRHLDGMPCHAGALQRRQDSSLAKR